MSVSTDDGPKLTPEQREALEVIDTSVALSAGAGCGKTTVLTERFLRHLEGPPRRPLSEIVALTFTDKAARELRERVRQSCRKKLATGEDFAHWRTVLRGLEAAPIGTFHAFCGRLLRRYPIEAGVEPGFVTLEETISPSFREEALALCFRRWLSNQDEDLIGLCVDLGIERVRQSLDDLIDARTKGDFQGWAEKGTEEILDVWKAAWQSQVLPVLLDNLRGTVRPVLELAERHECSHPKMRERLAFLREQLPILEPSMDLTALLGEIKENAKVQGGGTAKHWPEGVYGSIRDGLAEFRKSIDDTRKRLDWNEAASRDAAERGRRFARLAAEAIDIYEQAKQSRGLLDFDDLLLKTRDLLDRHPAVCEELARSVGVVLVDEFQDTDPIQGEIISRLTEIRQGDLFGSGRLFLVGDTKQSIYRFRGADPAVFETFRASVPDKGQRFLTENFRSRPEILDFVNALFAGAFPNDPPLKPGVALPTLPEDQPAIEFLWATEPETEHGGRISVVQKRGTEARWIARLLASRLKNGWNVRDEKTRELRSARAGDVVLLFRTLNDAAAYESALVAEGLDYYVVGGSAFFTQQEVLDLINLLTVLEDPYDPLALAGTLRSPFCGTSDEGLYWLATSPIGGLCECFASGTRVTGMSDEDWRRTARLQRLVAHWRGLKDRVPIAELLNRVLDESGYEAALSGEFLGDRKRANCRKLVRMARRYDEQGGYTLADFVARLRADLRKPPREEQATTTEEEGGDAVRLMSIHQAKGLEFPIVVVPDLNRNTPALRDTVAFHAELGLLTRPSDELETDDEENASSAQSLGWTVYRQLERHQEEQEALRLFYVATTRARDALILSAGEPADVKPKSPALQLLEERFDRTSGTCRAALPPEWNVPHVGVIATEPPSVRDRSGREKRAKQPRPLAVSELIGRTNVIAEPERNIVRPRPQFVDLDPSVGLPPMAARIDRLLRAVIADPDALNSDRVEAVIEQAALAQHPVAQRSVMNATIERWKSWLATDPARRLARASEVIRDLPWTLAWPIDDPNPTVYSGRMDFLYRDAQEGWNLIALAVDGAPQARERLRLLLSAHAASERVSAKIQRAWRIRLGPNGDACEETRFDLAEVIRAVDQRNQI